MQVHDALANYRRSVATSGGAGPATAPIFSERAFRLGQYANGSLLRVRGVICDVQDPELVVLGSGDDSGDAPLAQNQFVERIPLKISLFSHASAWATRAFEGSAAGRPTMTATSLTPGKGTKRTSEAVDVGGDVDMVNADSAADTQSKKPKGDDGGVEQTTDAPSFAAQTISVYVYDGQCPELALDAFRVNEAFEFIGILDLMVLGSEPPIDRPDSLTVRQLEELQISDCLSDLQRTGQSGVVLHCCDALPLDNIHHVRPNQSTEFYKQISASNAARRSFCMDEWRKLGHPKSIADIRNELVEYLARPLLGDLVAAEYLLLSLLSRVYARADPATPLGNLSLNLVLNDALQSDEKKKIVAEMTRTIRTVVPLLGEVDLSLQNLNETKFTPHKNYEQEALLGGSLQVPKGTTMAIDETALSTGQLNEQGVKNVDALQSLVGKMLLPYDFQYYSMDFPQDVSVVTVSESKSILPVTVSVPIHQGDSTSTPSDSVSEPLLECFRVYLGALRSLTVSIGNEEAEMAEKHYVECRKAQQNIEVSHIS